MSDLTPSGASTSPSAARNRDPIAGLLKRRLPKTGLVLEIASGTGEHAVWNARAMPNLEWQPTDADVTALVSIAAWRDYSGLPNLRPPLQLDAARPETWPINRADVVIAINMIHISPWTATQGLMAGASRVLQNAGILVLYGPYIEAGIETAPSNQSFDSDLRTRNSGWGLRNLEDVAALAARSDLRLFERVPMPANNLLLLFRKA